MPHPIIIAHRGASGIAPENTLAAFRAALESGAQAVELDIHASADDQIVVIHDRRLERTTDLAGLVKELSLADLKRADAGHKFSAEFAGETIPTLEEALDTLLPHVQAVIEIKTGGMIPKLLEIIEQRNALDQVSLISFYSEELKEAKSLQPAIKTGLLYSEAIMPKELCERTAEINADFLSVHFSLASPEMVDVTQDTGLPLWVWTVDDPNAQLALSRMDVSGIVTNFPHRLKALLETEL